ncbi:MAG: tRNA pseudouridine(54/55) synthase Pus10, partial [Thermoprotei archaeon]
MERSKEQNASNNIINKARKILTKYPLCDHCLGRLFAKLGLDLGNDERGRAIKTLLQMILHQELREEKINKEELRKYALNAGDPITRLYQKIFEEKITNLTCYICNNKL